MGRKEVLAERKALEEYYYNCQLETPEEVAKLFEVYTKLIWTHHQAGLVYDYYCDETVIRQEGGGKMVGGVDVAEIHTIPAFSAYPRSKTTFLDIFCVGDQEHGYRFGQSTTNSGIFSAKGANSSGRGDDSVFEEGTYVNFCQCYVNRVDGRWVVTEEYLGYGNEIKRQMMAGAQPYYKTVLGDPAERQLPVCEESAQRDDETVCEEEKA